MYFSDSVCTSTTFSSVTSLHPSSLLGMDVSHAASPMHRVTKKTQNIIDLTERCRCSSNAIQFEQRNVHATQSMNGMAITHVRENCLSVSPYYLLCLVARAQHVQGSVVSENKVVRGVWMSGRVCRSATEKRRNGELRACSVAHVSPPCGVTSLFLRCCRHAHT